MLELIVVTVVSWVIFDPIIVMNHDFSIPLGYTIDGLYEISINDLKPAAKGYEEESAVHETMVNDYLRLVDKVRSHPDIESATPLVGFCYPNSDGIAFQHFKAEDDSTKSVNNVIYRFLPNSSFFTTYGFENAAHYDTVTFQAYDMLITEGMRHSMFKESTKASQNRCISIENKDTVYYNIIGTVEDFKHNSNERIRPVALLPIFQIDPYLFEDRVFILFRLKDGINEAAFKEKFRSWMLKSLRSGNFYARSFRSVEARKRQNESFEGVTGKYRMNIGLAIFFLINLCLGVIGTFWIQTKSRKQEVGVMLSYGASPNYIIRMLWGEGFVLTTFSVFIGCILFLQYAWSEGLYRMDKAWSYFLYDYWVTHFDTHFIGVSFIVYAIILVVVLIGIFIPGYRISHIKPTEALHDE